MNEQSKSLKQWASKAIAMQTAQYQTRVLGSVLRSLSAGVMFILIASFCIGCQSKTYLMPTPNIYSLAEWDPFGGVPQELQGQDIHVLYVTDRMPKPNSSDLPEYGHARSRSLGFGEATVRIGSTDTWEQLVAASRTSRRAKGLPIELLYTQELARSSSSPRSIAVSDTGLAYSGLQTADSVQQQAEQKFRDMLEARLALTPRKEVFVYVHGFNNTFEQSVKMTAEIWHFLGREGVPVSYSWPAGVGSLRAYEYSLASVDFTVRHLKQTLRLIASSPDVESVSIISHSMGTRVVTDAIRELHLELRSTTDTQEALKLRTVVLAAADIDLDVMVARDSSEEIWRAVERTVLYISHKDKALGLSSWLSRGPKRVGDLDPKIFDPQEIEVLRGSHRFQIIDARISRPGALGHVYFHSNPAVSSDIVLALRYAMLPGSDYGRPLSVSENGIWMITDAYPGSEWVSSVPE